MSKCRSGNVPGSELRSPLTRWSAADALPWLRPPGASDHKGSRGILAVRIGSSRYPGAAMLGVSAAWRTGLGMVRYMPPRGDTAAGFGLPSPAAAVLAARPETLFGGGSSDAWLLGSGTDPADRSAKETAAITKLHLGEAPLVIDAGALNSALTRDSTSAPAVLTPHLGEFRRLWAAVELSPEKRELWIAESADSGDADFGTAVPIAAVACLATHLNATILLKGSTSAVASPQGKAFLIGPATPWLATAGTGDVLAGILGALVARHAARVRSDPEVLAELAATAALVHDVAARIVSGDDSPDPERCVGSPLTALDVANAVSNAIRQLR